MMEKIAKVLFIVYMATAAFTVASANGIDLSNISSAARESSHVVGTHWAQKGYDLLANFINQYITADFSNGSDNQSPRSECHNYDGDQFCVSWAVYSPHGMYSEELSDISDFAARCVKAGYSPEMRINLKSGTQETVCVSD
ncbi:hypothetical protein V1506DRAFT_535598 [Lipomyces tetrasporus]